MAQRIAVRIEVGSSAPLELVTELIQSINTVCNVAVALDRQTMLNRAARLPLPVDEPTRIELQAYLQRIWHRDQAGEHREKYEYQYPGRIQPMIDQLLINAALFGGTAGWPPAEAQAAFLLQSLSDTGPLVPTVERISYNNPLEIVLSGFTWGHAVASGVTGGSLLALLNFAAHVGPKREKLQAEAKKTTAEASKLAAEAYQIRTAAECKAELSRTLLRRVQESEAVLTSTQIDQIVDDQAVAAILELTRRPLEVEDQSAK